MVRRADPAPPPDGGDRDEQGDPEGDIKSAGGALPSYPDDDSPPSRPGAAETRRGIPSPGLVPARRPAGKGRAAAACAGRPGSRPPYLFHAGGRPRAARFPHPLYGEFDLTRNRPPDPLLMHEKDHQDSCGPSWSAQEGERAMTIPSEAGSGDLRFRRGDRRRCASTRSGKCSIPWRCPSRGKNTCEHYMGCDDRDAFRKAHRQARSRRPAARRSDQGEVARLQERIREGAQEHTPGTLELIRSLHAAGIPLALCSGALRIELLLQGSASPVSPACLGRERPEGEARSRGYIFAFRELTRSHPSKVTSTSSCLADQGHPPSGVKAAKWAGLKVLAVTNVGGYAVPGHLRYGLSRNRPGGRRTTQDDSFGAGIVLGVSAAFQPFRLFALVLSPYDPARGAGGDARGPRLRCSRTCRSSSRRRLSSRGSPGTRDSGRCRLRARRSWRTWRTGRSGRTTGGRGGRGAAVADEGGAGEPPQPPPVPVLARRRGAQ